jgi:hypothetical protein
MAIGAVAVALAVLGFLGSAQRVAPAGSWHPTETSWPGNPESDVAAIPLARTNLLIPLFASGWQPQFEVPSIPQPTRPQPPASPGQLPAGVYKTLPYTCIVVVPGPHPDDKCIVKPGAGDFSMPIIRPDVQFIPLHPLEK